MTQSDKKVADEVAGKKVPERPAEEGRRKKWRRKARRSDRKAKICAYRSQVQAPRRGNLAKRMGICND